MLDDNIYEVNFDAVYKLTLDKVLSDIDKKEKFRIVKDFLNMMIRCEYYDDIDCVHELGNILSLSDDEINQYFLITKEGVWLK
jgi:hypothetical protein